MDTRLAATLASADRKLADNVTTQATREAERIAAASPGHPDHARVVAAWLDHRLWPAIETAILGGLTTVEFAFTLSSTYGVRVLYPFDRSGLVRALEAIDGLVVDATGADTVLVRWEERADVRR